MSKVKCQISISADGFLAGPNQGEEHPLGEGGMALHEWAFKLASFNEMHGREGGETSVSDEILREAATRTGAVIMGRNMFGPVRGPWTEPLWNGWWGDEPPFRVPVFVLTHYEREPLTLGETLSTSSPRDPSARSSWRGRPPAAKRSRSAAAARRSRS